VSRRTGFTDSALVRLLARLTDITHPESRQGFADRLSQWFGWTDAISLSAALDGSPAATPRRARGPADAERPEVDGVRAALAKAIAERGAFASDFASHRRRYLARQQAMETAIGPLRGRLRAKLASASPEMARLAALDVVMEQVLGSQEHRLLATVPGLLEKHFERLRQAAERPADESDGGAAPGAWLDVFCRDMQGVLLAELDIRLQPIEGLIDALRKR
jgi:hypothetical protein